ncbi:MAG: hypothetical protein ACI8P9_000954 [Parasphingorhabdus sp.]|jgi:hypothetical protein
MKVTVSFGDLYSRRVSGKYYGFFQSWGTGSRRLGILGKPVES